MTQTVHVASLNVYENSSDKFTAIMVDHSDDVRTHHRTDFETLEEAKYWIKMEAWNKYGPVSFARVGRSGYRANVWKRT